MNIGEKNAGTIDRVIRIIAGIALFGVFALNMVAMPWSYLVALVGLIALVTGAVGTCRCEHGWKIKKSFSGKGSLQLQALPNPLPVRDSPSAQVLSHGLRG